MATRLYLTSGTAATYNPNTTKGAWDSTASITNNRHLGLVKTGAIASNAIAETVTTNQYDVAAYQFVSDPLDANQTISGTLDFSIGALESSTSMNAFTHLHIWVTQGDSTTLRGSLLTDYIGAAEFSTGSGGRAISVSGVSLTSVIAQAGDHIVVEVGYRANNTSATSFTGTIFSGGTMNDLSGTQNPTSTNNSGWVQFNTNLPLNLTATTFKVEGSTDDARNINGDSTYNDTVVTQHLGKQSTTAASIFWNGFRFSNVTIPQGATIVSANVVLYYSGNKGGTTAKTIWYGNAEDDSTTFANVTANKPEGKTRTSASVTKDFTTSGWTTVGYNNSDKVNVTTIVQEIVNRAGWVRGNHLTLIAGDNGSSNTNYIGHSTYNSATDRGAKLEVVYTSATSNVVSDSFNRANSTGLGNSDGSGLLDPFDWEGGGGTLFNIVSNEAVCQDSNGGAFVPGQFQTGSGVKDGLVEGELTPTTSGIFGLIGRLDGTINGYAVIAQETAGRMALSLFTLAGGSPDTELWASGGTYVLGSKVGLQMVGTTFGVYVNDSNESGDVTSSYVTTAGESGFFGDAGGIIDNFSLSIYNDPPIADDQSVEVTRNTPETITLTGSDPDSDPLTYSIASLPTHGDLSTVSHLVAADSFNRADGSLGSTDGAGSVDPVTYNFSPGTTYAIVSNRAKCTNDGGGGGVATLNGANPQNFDISVKIWPSTGGYGGVAARVSNGNSDGYVCSVQESDGSVIMYKNLGMGSTQIGISSTGVFTPGDTLRFTGIGTEFNAYVNGSLVIGPITDSTTTGAGDFSATTASTDTEFDDLSITSASAAISSVPTALSGTQVTYTPDTSYTGSDSFTFTVNDGLFDSSAGTVFITVIDNPAVAPDDSVTASDAQVLSPHKFISDSVTPLDVQGYLRSFPLFVDEGLLVFDDIQTVLGKTISDSVTTSDTLENLVSQEIDDTQSVTDGVENLIGKNIDDSVSVADTFEPALILEDSVTVSDAQAKTITKTLTESVTVSDSSGSVVSFTQAVNDSVTFTDAQPKTVHKALTDSVTAADSAPSSTHGESLSDTVSTADSQSKVIGHLVTDSTSASDTQAKTIQKNLTDSVTPSDETTPSTTVKQVDDSITASDDQAKTITKSLSSSVQADENFNYVIVFPLFVGSEATILDAVSISITKTITETVTVSDSSISTGAKDVDDSVTVSDAQAKRVTTPLSDAFNISDNSTIAITKTISETLTITDQVTIVGGSLGTTITDSVTISDAQTIRVNGIVTSWYVPDPQDWYEKVPQTWYNSTV